MVATGLSETTDRSPSDWLYVCFQCMSTKGWLDVASRLGVAQSTGLSKAGIKLGTMIQLGLLIEILRTCLDAHPSPVRFTEDRTAAFSHDVEDVQRHVRLLCDHGVLAIEMQENARPQGIAQCMPSVRILDLAHARRYVKDPIACLRTRCPE